MNQELYEILKDYLGTVAKVLNSLKQKFGEINYISAKNTEEVPKVGFFDSEQKERYNLHGAGITVDFKDISIVFDFDFHSSNHFGFNAWQLERFTKINMIKYPDLSSIEYGKLEEYFQNLLNELENKGEVKFDQTKNRYYLNSLKNVRL